MNNFFRKYYKKLVALLSIFVSFFLLYNYFTMNSYELTSYVNKFETVGSKKLDISFDDFNGFYKIINSNEEDFKILQLTDIHIGGSNASYENDKKAFDAMYKIIDYARPDFIILTGDMLFSSILSRNVNNANAAVALKIFMEKVDIPWTIAFGNHDYEFYNTHTQSEIEKIFSYNDKFLFNRAFYHDKNAYSNQAIKLYNSDGSFNTLILTLDSNELIKNETNSIVWYDMILGKAEITEGKKIPSLLFLHMPLYEYELAWNEREKNEGNYIYGDKREEICYEEKTSLFEFILKLDSTKGVFCGHDHLNDFSVMYKGVRLTYGKSIDYITYKGIVNKTEQRGGTLITIKKDSSFDVIPIALDSI